MPDIKEKAERFLQLHQGAELLILPNAWDVTSAGILEQASFKAIGTTSNAIAASLGYLDGERIPVTEMLAGIERIVRSTSLPVNADIEAGYGNTAADVAETVRKVIGIGAVGINLEDGTGEEQNPLLDMALQMEKLHSVRKAADSEGIHLVINARTDTWLVPFPDAESRFKETVTRANAYGEAGADCVFIPGLLDGVAIARLAAAIDAPINILATPVTPKIPELQAMGVARLSMGAGLFRAALASVKRIATELAISGSCRSLFEDTLSKAEVERLVPR